MCVCEKFFFTPLPTPATSHTLKCYVNRHETKLVIIILTGGLANINKNLYFTFTLLLSQDDSSKCKQTVYIHNIKSKKHFLWFMLPPL